MGHVKALVIDSEYARGTSIKLLVYPEIQSLISFANGVSVSNIQGALEGYGQPVQFTCDSKNIWLDLELKLIFLKFF